MKEDSVLFSIVVPIYGVEAYLPQAIESVLSQSVSDWELILVDDGSKDHSGEICDCYAALDERIHVIHKSNGGLVSARQAGIAQCTGEYVLNLDGDDYWDNNLLLELQAVIDRHQPDGVFFGFRKVTEENEPIGELHNVVEEGLYSGASLSRIWNGMVFDPKNPEINSNFGLFCHAIWSVAFRREVVTPFQQIVPQQIKMGEDMAVTIPTVCRCESIYFLDKMLYNYRIRLTSMTHTFSLSELKEKALLFEHLKRHADHLPSLNLACYMYRSMESFWVDAARNLPNYTEFRACVSDSFRTVSDDAIGSISKCRLKMKYRLRLFVVKHNLWYLFWLFYHRD